MPGRIAVIGAGMAGITCARRLADKGNSVILVDKGREIGGRLATRQSGGWTFDHGASRVDANTAGFRHVIERLAAVGAAAIDRDGKVLGLPSMNRLLAPLVSDLEIRLEAEAGSIIAGSAGWTIGVRNAPPVTGIKTLVLAVPAPQALTLLSPFDLDWTSALSEIAYAPGLTMMAGFDRVLDAETGVPPQPGTGIESQIRQLHHTVPDQAGDRWVVHAGEAWSRANLELDRDDIGHRLLARFRNANALPDVEPVYLRGHRWRYSRVVQPLGRSHLFDPQARIGYASDGCLGPNAEHAFLSGLALAETILAAA